VAQNFWAVSTTETMHRLTIYWHWRCHLEKSKLFLCFQIVQVKANHQHLHLVAPIPATLPSVCWRKCSLSCFETYTQTQTQTYSNIHTHTHTHTHNSLNHTPPPNFIFFLCMRSWREAKISTSITTTTFVRTTSHSCYLRRKKTNTIV